MPYKLKWEENGLYIKWFGKVSGEENIRSNGEIYGNRNFEAIQYQIVDFLDAETFVYSETDIKIISTLEYHASVWNKKLKIAHVTINSELISMIKDYESQMEGSGWKFAIFDNLEAARKWVNELMPSEKNKKAT